MIFFSLSLLMQRGPRRGSFTERAVVGACPHARRSWLCWCGLPPLRPPSCVEASTYSKSMDSGGPHAIKDDSERSEAEPC
jgi:hypothetical protein